MCFPPITCRDRLFSSLQYAEFWSDARTKPTALFIPCYSLTTNLPRLGHDNI